MPGGTWTGEGLLGLAWYSVRVTLPTECVEGERCGREKLIAQRAGHTCGGPFVLSTVTEEGGFLFDGPRTCPPVDPVLTPEGDTLRYYWSGGDVTITLSPPGK